jgi:hypothetical protein
VTSGIDGGGEHVNPLGFTVDCCAFGTVVAVAHARGDATPQTLCPAQLAGRVLATAGRRRRKVVVVGGLIVESGEGAGRVGAEDVLHRGESRLPAINQLEKSLLGCIEAQTRHKLKLITANC